MGDQLVQLNYYIKTMTDIISISQVRTHNKKDDCWIIIDNKVFNVTPFLKQHPGGADVILDLAGKDATEAFKDVGHSKDALDMLPDYLVGVLPENEVKKKGDAKKDGCVVM